MQKIIIDKDRIHEIEHFIKMGVDTLSEILSWFDKGVNMDFEKRVIELKEEIKQVKFKISKEYNDKTLRNLAAKLIELIQLKQINEEFIDGPLQ